MDNTNKIEAVSERDIDLLILEELNVSKDFAEWLYAQAYSSKQTFDKIGAWHSISDAALGESDLIAVGTKNNKNNALLIENKIDAIAQPEQAGRYKLRGMKGKENGLWCEFKTCMIAPMLYLKKEQDATNYDAQISYEEIADWFSSQKSNTQRCQYKAYIINEAIEQNRRGYTITPDDRVTEFWGKYWEFTQINFPDLEMKKPGLKPANSDWPDLRSQKLPRNVSIIHKLERGDVDLQIAGAADQLEDIQNFVGETDVMVVRAGKSAALRLRVDSIDRFSAFESQINIVEDGLNAARKLLNIGIKISYRL